MVIPRIVPPNFISLSRLPSRLSECLHTHWKLKDGNFIFCVVLKSVGKFSERGKITGCFAALCFNYIRLNILCQNANPVAADKQVANLISYSI